MKLPSSLVDAYTLREHGWFFKSYLKLGALPTFMPEVSNGFLKERGAQCILDCGTVCHLSGELFSPNIGHSSGDISLIGKL